MSTVRFESVSRGPITYLKVYGVVDESFVPSQLAAEVKGREVILNLKAVTRFSSFGVREWIKALGLLKERCERMFLVECSPAVVLQMNMVANFAGAARVVSIRVPYYCEGCGWDTETSLDLEPAQEPPQSLKCQSCGKAMLPDQEPDEYLAFRQAYTGKPMDPAIAEFLREFAGSGPREDAAPAGVDKSRRRPTAALWALSQGWVARLPPRARNTLTRLAAAPWWLVALVASGGLLVLVGVPLLVGFLWLDQRAGIPPTNLAGYKRLLAAERYEDAGRLVQRLQREGRLSPELAKMFDGEIVAQREETVQRLRRTVLSSYRVKEFDKVVSTTTSLRAYGPLDLEVVFTTAEALRRLKRVPEAVRFYEDFRSRAKDTAATDKRYDDALYWLGDAAAAAGNRARALELFERVLEEFPSSDFRKAAQKRVKELVPKGGSEDEP